MQWVRGSFVGNWIASVGVGVLHFAKWMCIFKHDLVRSSHTALIPSWDPSRWAAPQLSSIFGLSAFPLSCLEALWCLASGCSWGYCGRRRCIHFSVPDFPRDLNHRPFIHKPVSKTYHHQKLIFFLPAVFPIRDRAPFVLTSDMAYVINGGERPTSRFQLFVDLCCQAYNLIRKHSGLFLNLLSLVRQDSHVHTSYTYIPGSKEYSTFCHLSLTLGSCHEDKVTKLGNKTGQSAGNCLDWLDNCCSINQKIVTNTQHNLPELRCWVVVPTAPKIVSVLNRKAAKCCSILQAFVFLLHFTKVSTSLSVFLVVLASFLSVLLV